MQPPFSYQFMNAVEGTIHPSFLHIHNTSLSRFFKQYLLQDVLSVFKFTLPDWWDADYFRYSLLGYGYVAVFKTDKFGVIPQQCNLTGYNVFYRPTKAMIANPLIGGRELNIGRNCEIIKVMPDYSGIANVVDYYGDLMALTWEGITTNILNSKLAYIGFAGNKADAETFKKMYDRIASGEPAVIARKKSATITDDDKFQLFTQNLQQNYIAPQMMESLRNIQSAFRAEIGIPDLSVQKKERLITAEATKTDIYTRAKSMLWLETMREGIEKAKARYPEISMLNVEFRFPLDGGEEDASDTVSIGAV
nr:MAG TPA: upper collar protein [Caudoviricetes sp.]